MKVLKVLERINRGGFGIVDKVELENGSIVARKTFSPKDKESISDEILISLKRRFSREVKTQEKFPSEYFIPILFSSLEDEEPWFLMPIADKVYTDEIIDARINNSIPDGLADILNCLEYLHERSYVHRDLKPGNILYHEGNWKLADMGLITSDTELTTSYMTSEGFVAGSEMYMAPEQHTNFHNVTFHADIYSFGAILHDIFCNIKRVPCSVLTSKGEIGFIIKRCTEEKIYRRFKDISILRNVLLAFLSKKNIPNGNNDEGIEKWSEDLKTTESWDRNKLDSFLMYLEFTEGSKQILYYSITSELIESFYKIDIYLWKQFILDYFDWISEAGFNFDYCDVLIVHIFTAFEITSDLEVKTSGALAGAELGRSHNRWYVMRYVLKMCSHNIPDKLAERMAIEIHVAGRQAQNNLEACVDRLNATISRYHPKIQEILN